MLDKDQQIPMYLKCPLCKSTDLEKHHEYDNWGQTVIVYYVCKHDGIMFKDRDNDNKRRH